MLALETQLRQRWILIQRELCGAKAGPGGYELLIFDWNMPALIVSELWNVRPYSHFESEKFP
jgi:hypothetical protein